MDKLPSKDIPPTSDVVREWDPTEQKIVPKDRGTHFLDKIPRCKSPRDQSDWLRLSVRNGRSFAHWRFIQRLVHSAPCLLDC